MANDIIASPQLAKVMEEKVGTLQSQVGKMNVGLLRRENAVMRKENLLNQNSGLPFYLAPGNVGDVNKVFWPFWFTTTRVDVAPSVNISSGFSVTQEAAFVAISYTKAVFNKTAGPFNESYLDPDFPVGAGQATGLSWRFKDNQSTREFMDRTISLDHVGHPRFPTLLPAPMLIMPRANIEVSFVNSSANTYTVFMSFFGYRVRIEEAYNILSLVSQME